MDFVVLPDFGPTGQVSMRHNAGAAFDFNRSFDDDVRADLNVGFDLRLWVDHSCPMNADETLQVGPVFLHAMRPRIVAEYPSLFLKKMPAPNKARPIWVVVIGHASFLRFIEGHHDVVC